MTRQRLTKIICTLGPATSTMNSISRLIQNGMNVARLNFSHGTWDEHLNRIDLVRRAARDQQREIGILQDLSGPKIRLGDLPDGTMELKKGNQVRMIPITYRGSISSGNVIPVVYDHLLTDVPEGGRILGV